MYKITDGGKCINMTYKPGNTYVFHGNIKMCERGFHFCENPEDLLRWYDVNKDTKIFKVYPEGYTIPDHTKSVTDELTVGPEVDPEDLGINIYGRDEVEEVRCGNISIHYERSKDMVVRIKVNDDIRTTTYHYNEGKLVKEELELDDSKIMRGFDDQERLIYQQVYDDLFNDLTSYSYNGNICTLRRKGLAIDVTGYLKMNANGDIVYQRIVNNISGLVREENLYYEDRNLVELISDIGEDSFSIEIKEDK